MRNRARMLFPLTLIAVVAIAGISMAADGGSSSGSSGSGTGADSTAVADRSERVHKFRHEFEDADVRAVLEDIHEAVAKQAPDVAGPIIDKARADDKITEAQADKLRAAAQSLADGKRPDPGDLDLRDADVRKVVDDSLRALARRAPDIADPIIDKAVADDKITEAQADDIREMVQRKSEGPRLKLGGLGRGCGGPGDRPDGPGERGSKHFGPGAPPSGSGASGEALPVPVPPGTSS